MVCAVEPKKGKKDNFRVGGMEEFWVGVDSLLVGGVRLV
jgi:hypothetical protein